MEPAARQTFSRKARRPSCLSAWACGEWKGRELMEDGKFTEREPAVPDSKTRGNPIFFNQRGLRAGWRIPVFLLLAITSGLFLAPLAQKIQRARAIGALGASPYLFLESEVLILAPVLLASWIMSLIERRKMGDYGLPLGSPAYLPRTLWGYIFWGFLPL